MQYQVEIRDVLKQDQDALVLALVHAGYSVFLGVDENTVCFEASQDDVTDIKE